MILYHGTQTRHLPGMFASGKIFGYWSSDIETAIDFSSIMGPRDEDITLPPDRYSIVLATNYDIEDELDWFEPPEGFVDSSRVIYGLRYNGPEIREDIAYRDVRRKTIIMNLKNWKRISVGQLKRFKKRRQSFLDGMLFVEPDPIALAFKDAISHKKSLYFGGYFMGRNFKYEESMSPYQITENIQHDCDNMFDVIIIFDDGCALKYVSWFERDVDWEHISIDEVIRLERRTQQREYSIIGDSHVKESI